MSCLLAFLLSKQAGEQEVEEECGLVSPPLPPSAGSPGATFLTQSCQTALSISRLFRFEGPLKSGKSKCTVGPLLGSWLTHPQLGLIWARYLTSVGCRLPFMLRVMVAPGSQASLKVTLKLRLEGEGEGSQSGDNGREVGF